MSQAIVESVRVNYPTPLGAQHGQCLIDIAKALGGGAGLLKKDYGVFVVLPDGTKVSQDIICYPNGRIFDCLADGEGAAVPSWAEAHGSPITDLSRYYAVSTMPVPEPVPPPEPPAPVPPCQCGEVVELLTAMRLENTARHDAIQSQLHRLEVLSKRARKVRGKVSWSGTLDGQVDGVQSE